MKGLAPVFLLIAVLASTAARASDQTPPLNGIAHVALRVHDLSASESFYENLGFIRAFELSKDGRAYEAFIKINDRQFIELYPTTEKDPAAGFLHLCFEGADLNAIHDDYVSRGLLPISVRKAGAGNLLFTLVGPMQPAFPQNIEYTQYLPGSLHTKDTGLHLGPYRIADRMFSVSLAMQDPVAARAFYLDKLHFLHLAGTSAVALPGNSGQTIDFVPASTGSKAHITLQTGNLKEARIRLNRQRLSADTAKHRISVSDPDGNIIVITEVSPK